MVSRQAAELATLNENLEHRVNDQVKEIEKLASRLCDAAGDGQILFSKKTYIAVEDEVEASKIGEFDLKGMSKPVVVYDLKHRI